MKNKKIEKLFFKCSCSYGQQLQVNNFDDGSFEINTRLDGRRKWTGVVLKKKEIKKLIVLLNLTELKLTS
ncbi:hypothetical protein A2774_01615 [Candidatus Roizmanbacteria bacterium RIFCSPHIGHO2_01_FULL_39_12c]|uniref:Uncharacterized protein n=1 Tax=Candidatus Roizmanbacteria bacterium RIFCSPHIGHO2_01_FULL_39_12c TaxID=1802031 RepID=A0A1F7G8G6_9BACT|nr:MAG: hypothetical protein A2774_01615 [Candidatus Roizmanbacteria bacterium RIFCSPHIGHO2_01_FULL_39_12c]OGK46602.1 MAG: hypothetical protein A2963_02625 [Candidatus Roizmanbacteria bacterium RIFCSPLOWO2_01_FULL_40_13]